MKAADLAFGLFAVCNTLRVFAYVPQMISVAQDRHGASAISYTTWALFAVSHLSTVAYAILDLGDWRMAGIFAANATCCGIILGLTRRKRADHRSRICQGSLPIAPSETAVPVRHLT